MERFKKSFSFFTTLIFSVCLFISNSIHAQLDYEKQLVDFAKSISVKITKAGKSKIAVSNFLDNNGSETELGKVLAEELAIDIVNLGNSFQIIEREDLKAILKEHKLTSTGLIDLETAKQLGKLKAVDAIVVGTIFPFGDNLRINIKILDTETGVNVGGISGGLTKTDAITKLFDTKLRNDTSIQISNKSTPEMLPIIIKGEKPQVGDFCFHNVDRVGYKASVSIYQIGKSEVMKSVDVIYGEKSCMYELTAGIYKIIVTWSDRWGNNIPSTIKEIKIQAGSESNIELQH